MAENLDRYKSDLAKLLKLGSEMFDSLTSEEVGGNQEAEKGVFEKHYQDWYTEAYEVIEQIIPNRLEEFKGLYQVSKRKEVDQTTFCIHDWLIGVRASTKLNGEKYFNDLATVAMRFNNQLNILKASGKKFVSSLFEIKQLVQADLFDSEIEAAKELLKNGFLRGAGAVAGVVLEKHLSQVCDNHNLKIRKKNPHISDFNEILKENDVFQIPEWRNIQRLADLRNLCDHDKKVEPKKEQVAELIEGVEKVIKTIF